MDSKITKEEYLTVSTSEGLRVSTFNNRFNQISFK